MGLQEENQVEKNFRISPTVLKKIQKKTDFLSLSIAKPYSLY